MDASYSKQKTTPTQQAAPTQLPSTPTYQQAALREKLSFKRRPTIVRWMPPTQRFKNNNKVKNTSTKNQVLLSLLASSNVLTFFRRPNNTIHDRGVNGRSNQLKNRHGFRNPEPNLLHPKNLLPGLSLDQDMFNLAGFPQ
ncbi:hypothetical protein GOBAR_AA06217 [Gossypium barbadense]|uniref:Uncharacterized protein n=1 Tax=Gossypium barbadense TaxID=3634 RepID=A0A2P5YFL6_GOSBA|nr:hypothetical protein GOBAR_AA06217 [Gossypium barbadense]